MLHSRLKLIVILIAALLAVQGCRVQSTSFFVENAAFLDQEEHEKNLNTLRESGAVEIKGDDYLFMLKKHRITEGKGTIIAFRLQDRGSLWSIDDETYQNVTIFIPHQFRTDSGEIKFEDEKEIIVFYSGGLAGFLDMGCYGYARKGYVRYNKTLPNNISVEIYFDGADFISPLPSKEDKCDSIVFKESLTLGRKLVNESNIDLAIDEK